METITDLSISLHPTKKHFQEIEKWLISEYKKGREGFYCNWNSITASYTKEQIAIVVLKDSAIGFATWFTSSGHTASIQISEIKLLYRPKGIGQFPSRTCFNTFLIRVFL